MTMKHRVKKMIIGLTGPNASGKGEAARYLASKKFKYHSLSDIIREETAKHNMKLTRDNLIFMGNALRKCFGPGILAKAVKYHLTTSRELVDSIRNPEEVRELRKMPGFVLLGVTAPVRMRYARAVERGRAGAAKSIRDFIRKEKKENSPRKTDQQLKRCFKLADFTIINDGSMKDLLRKVDRFLAEKR